MRPNHHDDPPALEPMRHLETKDDKARQRDARSKPRAKRPWRDKRRRSVRHSIN